MLENMNADRIHIANPERWITYYKNVVNGRSHPYVNHMKSGYQRGGGLGGYNNSFMIPIDRYTQSERESEPTVKLQLTAPSQ